jgi:hypothetical protein
LAIAQRLGTQLRLVVIDDLRFEFEIAGFDFELLIGLVLTSVLSGALHGQSADRPNIVVVLSMTWG